MSPVYRVIKWIVKACYPKMEAVRAENLPDEPVIEECGRICDYLMRQITKIACSLPEHTVVPTETSPRRIIRPISQR